MQVADFVNESPPSARLGALSKYVLEEGFEAPIDMYRKSIKNILDYGTTERLEQDTFLGRFISVGLVSAAEGYFRAIMAICMEVCPIARATASAKTIHLGGLLWHGKSGFSRSAFENSSFSSRAELSKAIKEYIGFSLNDTKFKDLLDEFDKVCHLRHGIVHGDGFLPGKNAVHLEIQKSRRPLRITIKYTELQEMASVINTLVFTLNRELFVEMCKRWAIDWRRRDDWNPQLEAALFSMLWNTFHSKDENRTRAGRSHITKSRCKEEVRALFGL